MNLNLQETSTRRQRTLPPFDVEMHQRKALIKQTAIAANAIWRYITQGIQPVYTAVLIDREDLLKNYVGLAKDSYSFNVAFLLANKAIKIQYKPSSIADWEILVENQMNNQTEPLDENKDK